MPPPRFAPKWPPQKKSDGGCKFTLVNPIFLHFLLILVQNGFFFNFFWFKKGFFLLFCGTWRRLNAFLAFLFFG